MNELKVGNHVGLKSIVKSPDEEEPTIWFAQVNKKVNMYVILVKEINQVSFKEAVSSLFDITYRGEKTSLPEAVA